LPTEKKEQAIIKAKEEQLGLGQKSFFLHLDILLGKNLKNSFKLE
jgi:hypothetical protein